MGYRPGKFIRDLKNASNERMGNTKRLEDLARHYVAGREQDLVEDTGKNTKTFGSLLTLEKKAAKVPENYPPSPASHSHDADVKEARRQEVEYVRDAMSNVGVDPKAVLDYFIDFLDQASPDNWYSNYEFDGHLGDGGMAEIVTLKKRKGCPLPDSDAPEYIAVKLERSLTNPGTAEHRTLEDVYQEIFCQSEVAAAINHAHRRHDERGEELDTATVMPVYDNHVFYFDPREDILKDRFLKAIDPDDIMPEQRKLEWFKEDYKPSRIMVIPMGLAYGEELQEYVRDELPDPLEGLKLFRRIVRGVRIAHQAGVVNCDLKPNNMLVEADGNVTILDFGLAELLDGSKPANQMKQMLAGTPEYMTPGHLYSNSVLPDVDALHKILHVILTGKEPEEFNIAEKGAVGLMNYMQQKLDYLDPKTKKTTVPALRYLWRNAREFAFHSAQEIEDSLEEVIAQMENTYYGAIAKHRFSIEHGQKDTSIMPRIERVRDEKTGNIIGYLIDGVAASVDDAEKAAKEEYGFKSVEEWSAFNAVFFNDHAIDPTAPKKDAYVRAPVVRKFSGIHAIVINDDEDDYAKPAPSFHVRRPEGSTWDERFAEEEERDPDNMTTTVFEKPDDFDSIGEHLTPPEHFMPEASDDVGEEVYAAIVQREFQKGFGLDLTALGLSEEDAEIAMEDPEYARFIEEVRIAQIERQRASSGEVSTFDAAKAMAFIDALRAKYSKD